MAAHNDDDDVAGAVAGETRPLLERIDPIVFPDDDDDDSLDPVEATDLPAEFVPSLAFQWRVGLTATAIVTIIMGGQLIMSPATQEIMEDIICHDKFPDHAIGSYNPADPRCKDNKVQDVLAMVRAWSGAAEMIVPLFVQLPFGVVADKYGRKPVMFSALVGVLFSISWTIFVLANPQRFSVWATIYGNIAFLIGGGGTVAVAMCYTVVTDAIPAANRSTVFYYIIACSRIITVLLTPLSAYLLDIDPWMTQSSGFIVIISGVFLTLMLPETLILRQKADDKRRTTRDAPTARPLVTTLEPGASSSTLSTFIRRSWTSAQNDMSHIWHFLLGSKSIMALIVASGFLFPVRISFAQDVTQYMTKRYNWTWAEATYVMGIENATGVFALMVLLPIFGHQLTKRGYSTLRKDLLIAQVASVFIVFGTVLIAFAFVPQMCIVALVLYSFGAGYAAVVRSILSMVVEPHTIGSLNTVLAMLESSLGAVFSPPLGWLLKTGFNLGGIWMGLPYLVVSLAAVAAMLLTLTYRIPKSFGQI